MLRAKNTIDLYTVHPSVRHAQSILKNLSEKTGKPLAAWISFLHKAGPKDEKEQRVWLKQKYRLGGTTAALIAELAAGRGREKTDGDGYLQAAVQYVENMYSGAKSGLRPLHDVLIDLGLSLGDDVKISPCKTIVPFYRNHVFAEIKPATRSRIDLGLCLRHAESPLAGRLIASGGLAKGDRITHRFSICALQEIDHEVKRWLKIAYEMDG